MATQKQVSPRHHFEGKATAVRATYDKVLAVSREFGRIVEDPKKTSIHLVNKTAFAGVATRKDFLILTIKSDRKLTSKRFRDWEQVSQNRYHYEVVLSTPADVDRELIGWLKEAYDLSGGK